MAVYDLIVIGGGPGGYRAAERAGKLGYKTLLIEKNKIGGVCLNEGCIPSKTFLNSAKIYENTVKGSKYGVTAESINYDQKVVFRRKNKVVKSLVLGVKATLKKHNVEIIEGVGKIIQKVTAGYEIEVKDNLKDEQNIYIGKKIIIASGSMPVIPAINGVEEGLKSGLVLTNREILDLAEIPTSLVIVGGGVIGLEMAVYFNTVGCKVTVVEMLDHIGGNIDREIADNLLNIYKKKGIKFCLNAKLVEVGDGYVNYENSEGQTRMDTEKILMSVGRKPFLEDLGLENIGIQTENGRILTDESLQTNIQGVYAIGDVNGQLMLAHTAYREAEVCINNISGKKDLIIYSNIPAVIYGSPEVATVGKTEEEALLEGIDYEKAVLPLTYSGRYLAENEEKNGIIKVLVDKKDQKLIGVHIIGSYVSEIIYGAGMMLEMEFKVEDIKKIVFPHPTVSEILYEAIWEL